MWTSEDERQAWFDAMRATEPVHFDAASRTFILTRMDDARQWLSDPAQWKDADQAEEGAMVRLFKPADMNRPGDRNSGMGWMDEPNHSRVRRPIQAALAKRVAGAKAAIEAIVSRRLDALPEGAFDAFADFALPIPVAVIGHILGVDTADVDQFRAWSEAALNVFDPNRTEADRRVNRAAVAAICDYFDDAMDKRRRRPTDDLVSDLLAVQAETGALSDSEIRINCLDLLLGGNVTTADLIGNGIWLLLRHPDELAKLRSDPSLIGGAIEEILRLEPPVEGAQRVAANELTLRGCPVHAHQVVAVMTPAANRDPAVFSEPHRFDITRRDGPHITFGAGAHTCIGAPLARLEARIAILALVQRFPNLALADPGAAPRWRRQAGSFHGLESLPVRT